MEAFPGLGFTNITVSCHHDTEDKWLYEQTLKMSEARTVYAMEDMSAFFIKDRKPNETESAFTGDFLYYEIVL